MIAFLKKNIVVFCVIFSIIIITVTAFIAFPLKSNYTKYDMTDFNSTFENTKININTADWFTLSLLDDIGEVKAKAIVAHRIKNGDFKTISDIMDVHGIGEKIFNSIKNDITV